MIQFAPELAPLTRESRDLLSLLVRSMSMGASLVTATQHAPVTRFVRMPRYVEVGLVFRDGAQLTHTLEGKRDLRGTRDPSRRLVQAPDGPADIARTRLDAIAIKLRHALSEGNAILAAFERIPEAERQPWQEAILRTMRTALPTLETLAYAENDGARRFVPSEA